MILEVIGALVLTGAAIYVTLAALAMQFFSDESYFFGLRDEPVGWLIWHVGSLGFAGLTLWAWWTLVGSNITIGFS